MNVSLYQAAAAMNANSRWQEIIAQNLAAGPIPGYKKQDLTFAAIEAGRAPSSPGQVTSGIFMPSSVGGTNFAQGEVQPTGVKTDFAIDGSGFFEVQLPNGARAYTRDGAFNLNAQGQLVTQQGYLVMGESGSLQFDSNNPASFDVAPTGEVSQAGEAKGKIKLVDFNDPHLLTAVGGGYFQATDPKLVPSAASGASIRQGYLEGSNTSATAEMASLITSIRMFEANQKVMSMQDERMGRAISDLGNPA